jgi:hypothetical protein
VPRYQSLKSGRFVSEYYAKRHPTTTVEVPLTVGEAREAARKIRSRRDEARESALTCLSEVARRNPELRVGQLLVNALPLGLDPFYVEDAQLSTLLRDFEARYRADEGGE